ncbi:MAG TPA: aldehyde dehydrogenase family protein, partial [Polyangiaceae bacterium]
DGFDPSRPDFVPYRVRELGRDEVVRAIERVHAARAAWADVPAGRREEILLAVAEELRRARGELIARMVLDAGKRAVEADAEVSEAVDFAEYYARQHARLRGRFALEPKGLVVVTPPWNFPLSIGIGGVLAALVAGNVVLLKPPPETPLVLASAVEICLRAGVPAEALGLVITSDEAAEPLVTDPRVAAVVLTGGTETARLFRRLRPDLDLIAETGGKNALIVSAMSDREQAIQHAVRAAFGHAGQKCSALSVLILEREVYRSASFKKKLADAVSSLAVGSAWDLESFVTPLIHPPAGALARAIDALDPGESWLVEPARSPRNPRLLRPSVRWDVQPQSFAHVTELFGPVLSVFEANDFDHALEIANGTPYGLTAGLESLDAREHAAFLERMQAGNLYVNRPVTGAVVGRQPFGGHKASSFGPGYKAGGPNTLLALVRVRGELGRAALSDAPLSRGPRASAPGAKIHGMRPPPDLGVFGEVVADKLRDAERPEQERLARRLRSYESALLGEIDVMHAQDEVLGHEDALVYRPCRAAVVVLRGVDDIDLLSTLLAAHMVGAEAEFYAQEGASDEILRPLGEDVVYFQSLGEIEELVQEGRYERVRVVGADLGAAFAVLGDTSPSLDVDPVSDSGYIELRRYVTEQSRSVALHRYGNLSLYLAQKSREKSEQRA